LLALEQQMRNNATINATILCIAQKYLQALQIGWGEADTDYEAIGCILILQTSYWEKD
jgi:hypothetical protein